MQEPIDQLRYLKRYKKVFIGERINAKIHDLKRWLLTKIFNSSLSNHLDPFDIKLLEHSGSYKRYSDTSFNYRDITLSELHFFEAIEIDNFDKYKARVISKFARKEVLSKELKENLSTIKEQFDTISWGHL